MQKFIFFSLSLIMSASSFSQQNNPAPVLTKQDYLKKSKTQRMVAACLLLSGSITWLAGANKYMNQGDNIDGGGETAMVVGGLACLASIPLFIIASKNKKKARQLAINDQRVPHMQNNSLVYRTVPSLSLKIQLGKR